MMRFWSFLLLGCVLTEEVPRGVVPGPFPGADATVRPSVVCPSVAKGGTTLFRHFTLLPILQTHIARSCVSEPNIQTLLTAYEPCLFNCSTPKPTPSLRPDMIQRMVGECMDKANTSLITVDKSPNYWETVNAINVMRARWNPEQNRNWLMMLREPISGMIALHNHWAKDEVARRRLGGNLEGLVVRELGLMEPTLMTYLMGTINCSCLEPCPPAELAVARMRRLGILYLTMYIYLPWLHVFKSWWTTKERALFIRSEDFFSDTFFVASNVIHPFVMGTDFLAKMDTDSKSQLHNQSMNLSQANPSSVKTIQATSNLTSFTRWRARRFLQPYLERTVQCINELQDAGKVSVYSSEKDWWPWTAREALDNAPETPSPAPKIAPIVPPNLQSEDARRLWHQSTVRERESEAAAQRLRTTLQRESEMVQRSAQMLAEHQKLQHPSTLTPPIDQATVSEIPQPATIQTPQTMTPQTEAPQQTQAAKLETTTQVPVLQVPATQVPATQVSSTQPSSTQPSSTQASSTQASSTQASSTQASSTQASSTQASSTQASSTQASTQKERSLSMWSSSAQQGQENVFISPKAPQLPRMQDVYNNIPANGGAEAPTIWTKPRNWPMALCGLFLLGVFSGRLRRVIRCLKSSTHSPKLKAQLGIV